MKVFHIPYCLFQSLPTGPYLDGRGLDGVYDVSGQLIFTYTGQSFPVYDTLIGIVNRGANAARLHFKFHHANGAPVKWSDGTFSMSYDLPSSRCLNMTLIPNNPFPAHVEDFVGHGAIEVEHLAPFGNPDVDIFAELGGGGLYPDHWNTISPHLPVYEDSEIVPTKSWSLAYGIRFRDVNHDKFAYTMTNVWHVDSGTPRPVPHLEGKRVDRDNAYGTSLAITNLDTFPIAPTVTYVVGESYAERGQSFSIVRPVLQPGCVDTFDVFDNLPVMPNTEGWIKVEVPTPARYLAYGLLSNKYGNQFGSGVFAKRIS